MKLEPLPREWARLLERFRIRSQRRERPALTGGHLMRRKGQSLEFRDFGTYVPGDDIRHVDWRTSARAGFDELLVRRFLADDQLTVVVSVDNRDTMFLPEALSKIQVAAWLAECLARIAGVNGDRVLLHSLFGGEVINVGSHGFGSTMARVFQNGIGKEEPKLKALVQALPPTAIWVVISDYYFHMDLGARRLAAQISAALAGFRWVICLDLDAWPHEKTLLGQGNRRLEGPGLDVEDPRYRITPEVLTQVEQEIQSHKSQFDHMVGARAVDRLVWHWPEAGDLEPTAFFRERFFNEPVFQRLFMRSPT